MVSAETSTAVPQIRRSIIQGTVSPDDRDVFRIDSEPNERVEVYLTQTDEFFHSSSVAPSDQTIEIFPLSHQFLPTFNARVFAKATGGVHFVSVEPLDSTVDEQFYTLTVLTYTDLEVARDWGDPGDTLQAPTEPSFYVSPGIRSAQIAGSFNHSSQPQGDVDYYALGELFAGQSVNVSVVVPEWNIAQIDVSLVDASGNPVEDLNPDSSEFTGEAPVDGEFFARLASSESGAESQYVLTLATAEDVAPHVVSIEGLPEDGQTGNEFIFSFDVSISEPADPGALSEQAFELLEAGEDGLFETEDDREFRLVSKQYASGIGIEIEDGPIADGSYRFVVTTGLTDRHGNPLPDEVVRTFSVELLADDEVFESAYNHSPSNARLIDLNASTNDSGWLISPVARGTIEDRDAYVADGELLRGDIDYWAFDGLEGDFVYVTSPEPPKLGRAGQSGYFSELSAEQRSERRVLYRLPKTGRYYLRHDRYSRGPFAVSYAPTPAPSLQRFYHGSVSYSVDVITSPSIPRLGDYSFSLQVNRHAHTEQPEGYEEANGQIEKAESLTLYGGDGQQVATIGGTIDRQDDVDIYGLGRLSVSNQITVDASVVPEWSGAVPEVKVWFYGEDASGELIELADNNDDPAIFAATVEVDAMYFLEVSQVGGAIVSARPDGDQYSVDLAILDTVSPHVVSANGLPDHGGESTRLIDRFSMEFDSRIKTLDDTNSIAKLISAGADGVFSSGDEVSYVLDFDPGDDGQSIAFEIANGPLSLGDYRLQLLHGITDIAGNAVTGIGGGDYVRQFSIVQDAEYCVYESAGADSADIAGVLAFEEDANGTGWSRSEIGYGTIQSDSDVDTWRISVEAGEQFEIVASSLATSSRGDAFPPKLSIYREQVVGGGSPELVELLPSEFDSRTLDAEYGSKKQRRVTVHADASADYVIAVSQESTSQIGDYEVQVFKSEGLNTAVDVSHYGRSNQYVVLHEADGGLAATLRGQFNEEMEKNTFRFAYLRAGDRITIDQTRLADWNQSELPTLSVWFGLRYFPHQGAGIPNEAPDAHSFQATVPYDGWYSLSVSKPDMASERHIQFALEVKIEDSRAPHVENFFGIPTFDGFTAGAISSFNIQISEPTDVASLPGSMDLRSPGPDRLFDTDDDVIFQPVVGYDPDTMLLTARLLDQWLAGDHYRLSFSGEIRDLAGYRFDGNGDGIGGDDYRHHFTIGAFPSDRVFDNSENNHPASATLIPIDQPEESGTGWARSPIATGRLQSTDQVDWWQFDIEHSEGVRIEIDTHGDTSESQRIQWIFGVLDPVTHLVDPLGVVEGQTNPRFEITQSLASGTLVIGASVRSGEEATDDAPVDLSYDISVIKNGLFPLFSGVQFDGSQDQVELELKLSRDGGQSTGTVAGVLEGDKKQVLFFLGTLDAGTPVELGLNTVESWSFDHPRVRLLGLDLNGAPLAEPFVDLDASEERLSGTVPMWGQYFAVVEYASFTRDGYRYSYYGGPATWEEANAEALSRGASLVSIHSTGLTDALRWRFGDGYWTGLSSIVDLESYRWSDGTPVDYSNWRYYQSPNGSDKYVYFGSGGKWYVGAGDEKRSWVEQEFIGTSLDDSQSIYYLLDISIQDPSPVNVESVTGLPNVVSENIHGVPADWPKEILTDSFALAFSEFVEIESVFQATSLVWTGPDGVFDTADDERKSLHFEIDGSSSPGKDIRSFVVTIVDGPLREGDYRLEVDESLRGQTGAPFDGDGDGAAGGIFRYDFIVDVLAGGGRLESSPNESLDDAERIELQRDSNETGWSSGGWSWGVVDSASDVDWWAFDAVQGQQIELIVASPDYRYSDLEASLYWVDTESGEHDRLASIGFYWDSRTRQAIRTASETGTYYLKIKHANQYSAGYTEFPLDYRFHVSTYDGEQIAVEELMSTDSSTSDQLTFVSDGVNHFSSIAASAFFDEAKSTRGDAYPLGRFDNDDTVTVSIRRSAWLDQPSLVSIVDGDLRTVRSKLVTGIEDALEFLPDSDTSYSIEVLHEGSPAADSYYVIDVQVTPSVEELPSGVIVIDGAATDSLASPIAAGPETDLQFIGQWKVITPVISGNRLFHKLESGDQEIAIATGKPWTNPIEPHDVDHNGVVTPLDALMIINRIAINNGGSEILLQSPEGNLQHRYYDVTGDERLTPRDALVVINKISRSNAMSVATGEQAWVDSWDPLAVDLAVSDFP